MAKRGNKTNVIKGFLAGRPIVQHSDNSFEEEDITVSFRPFFPFFLCFILFLNCSKNHTLIKNFLNDPNRLTAAPLRESEEPKEPPKQRYREVLIMKKAKRDRRGTGKEKKKKIVHRIA